MSTTQTIKSNGIGRTYLLHLPVVLFFHGRTRTSEDQEELTGMDSLNAIVASGKSNGGGFAGVLALAGVTRYVWRVARRRSSTTPNPDSGTPTVIDATPIIWRSFLSHPLR